jgi:hypothetical protein
VHILYLHLDGAQEAHNLLTRRIEMKRQITILAIIVGVVFNATGQPTLDQYLVREAGRTKSTQKVANPNRSENLTAPANDNFANAQVIGLPAGGNQILSGNNISGSKEPNEPNHAENLGGSSVWFTLTAAATQNVEIRTISNNTDFDTTVAVYQGNSIGTLVPVGYNDDCYEAACGTRSRVRFRMTAGTVYHIAVDGYFNGTYAETGNFGMVVQSSFAFGEDNINQAYDLGTTVAGSLGGTNGLATGQPGEPSHANGGANGGHSVWYKFRTANNRAMTFELKNDDFGSEIGLYRSAVEFPTFADLTKVDEMADHIGNNRGVQTVTFFAQGSTYYFIAIDHNNNNSIEPDTGNFQLSFYQTRLRPSARFDRYTGQAALSVFRPSNGVWYTMVDYATESIDFRIWGKNGDQPLPSDWDGDGITDLNVVRNQNGQKVWYWQSTLDPNATGTAIWGLATDQAYAGDFDRDGRADQTVVRGQNGQRVWYVRQSSNGALRSFVFGLDSDKIALGDFDGDGATDITVARPEGDVLTWYILRSNGNLTYSQYSVVQFGVGSDDPVVEDYDGDGKTDIAVFRQTDASWYILRSSDGSFMSQQFGNPGDHPEPADYDNDGKADLGLFRTSNGTWNIWSSYYGAPESRQWGLGSDIPVTSVGYSD